MTQDTSARYSNAGAWATYMAANKQALRMWKTLRGRASRSEFWYWTLTYVVATNIAVMAAGLLDAVLFALGVMIPVVSIAAIAATIVLTVPTVTAAARRLHDSGSSAAWVWINVALAIALPVLVIGAIAGTIAGFTNDAPTVILVSLGVAGLGGLVALGAAIVMIVKLVQPSQPEENAYGSPPAPLVANIPRDA